MQIRKKKIEKKVENIDFLYNDQDYHTFQNEKKRKGEMEPRHSPNINMLDLLFNPLASSPQRDIHHVGMHK